MEEKQHGFSIKKYLSITIVLTILSQFSLFTYFNTFGINPLHYFEPTEIIISSGKDFVLIAIFLFLWSQVISLFLINRRKKILNTINLDKFILYYFIGVTVYLAVSILIFWLLGSTILPGVIAYCFFLVYFLVLVNNRKMDKLRKTDREEFEEFTQIHPYIDSTVILLGISYIGILWLISIDKAEETVIQNIYVKSEIQLNSDEIIKVTSKVILIGRSKQFLFLFNTPDSSVRVIKREEIKKEVIKRKDRSILSGFRGGI